MHCKNPPVKKIYILTFFTFLYIYGFVQPVAKIPRYTIQPAGSVETQLIFDMDFGKAVITHITGDTTLLHNAGEIMIDMVCTDYPANLSLVQLNTQRLQAFFAMFPYLTKSQVFLQSIFRQTDGSTEAASRPMFHGLVVTFRPRQNDTTMHGDLEKLTQMLEVVDVAGKVVITTHPATIIKDTVAKPKPPAAGTADSKSFFMTIIPDGGDVKETGHGTMFGGANMVLKNNPIPLDIAVTMSPAKALKKQIIDKQTYESFKGYKSIVILVTKTRVPVPTFTVKDLDKYTKVDKLVTVDKVVLRPRYPPVDSTVLKILARNKFKDATIVGDVTASMYVYTGQLLLWIKLSSLDSLAADYIFFNDGNGMPDYMKQLGKAGGIYSRECHTYEEVELLAKTTMQRGSGGDIAENDIEALLYAEATFPQNKYEILLADNWAPVRDKILMTGLTKPVKIILCGADDSRINCDYLNIARQTKGSIHLANIDIANLDALHEGDILSAGSYRYIIKNNVFEYY